MKVFSHTLGRVAVVLTLGLAGPQAVLAQTGAPAATGEEAKRYELGGITISGARYLDTNTLIGLTGLRVGDPISLPGEEIGKAIRKLWDQGILGDVSVSVSRIDGNRIFLDFNLKERPRLSKFEFSGISKSQADDLKNKIKLIRGKVVTDALLSNTKTQVRKFYTNKGFLDTKVNIVQVPDSSLSNSVVLNIAVDKGGKSKIREIAFEGNEAFKDSKLKGKFKKTKEKKFPKLLNSGKFQRSEFEDDKTKLIDFYNSQGYRDAVVVSDTLIRNGESLALRVTVDEGPKYYFRNITWAGNYLYDDKTLASVLGIKQGSIYSKETLDKRLNYNPTGQDITSLDRKSVV